MERGAGKMQTIVRTSFVALAVAGFFGSSATDAAAADRKSNVYTMDVINIVGRVQKPIESVDIGMIAPRLTLSELRQPFIDRIEDAIKHDPF